MRFIESKSLSVSRLILLKEVEIMKTMRTCLVAYVKQFKRGGCDIFAKWRKLEIRVVIKYFCEKGMPPKEIHEDLMKALRRSSEKRQLSLRGRERALRIMDGLATQNMPPLMKMSRSCTPCLCVI